MSTPAHLMQFLSRASSFSRARSEQGFSLIEVGIASFVLATVVGAAAFATVSNDSVLGSERASSQKAQIARKALEQAEGDLAARDACSAAWRPGDATGTYADCRIGPYRLADADGRNYDAAIIARAVDLPEDGRGASDTDMNPRDRFAIQVTVKVGSDTHSKAGLSKRDIETDYVLPGQVDWTSARGTGTARISVCALDRPDRSISTSRCVGGALPVDKATVTLTPHSGVSGSAVYRSTIGGVAAFKDIKPGTYAISAAVPSGSKLKLHRITPKLLTVTGSEVQEGAVFLTRPGSQVMVCARTVNPDIGWGWEINKANMSYHQLGGHIRRTMRLDVPYSGSPRCGKIMVDPLGYHQSLLFRGQYGLEVQQFIRRPTRGKYYGMRLERMKLDSQCGGATSGSADTTLQKVSSLPAPGRSINGAVLGIFKLGDDLPHTICLEFRTQPIYDEVCQDIKWPHTHYTYKKGKRTGSYTHWHSYNPKRYPPECRKYPPKCVEYCPNGETKCISNCDGDSEPDKTTKGSAGGWNRSDESQFAYGPNDSSVPCRTPRGKGVPYGSGKHAGHMGNSLVKFSKWNTYDWVGNGSGAGRHADGSISICREIGFAFGSHKIPEVYKFGDCIEMSHNGNTVRGKVWDVGPQIGDRIQPSIAAWAGIYPNDPDITEHAWGYAIGGHNGGRWPAVKYRHIKGDPVCHSMNGVDVPPDGNPGPVYKYFPPKIKPAQWRRAVDDRRVWTHAPLNDMNPFVNGRRFL